MTNRNKLIEKFIGNFVNAVVHKICLKAVMNLPEISELGGKYEHEQMNSWKIAQIYREKINPKIPPFPTKDLEEIREKAIGRVKSEINSRISKGYKNLDAINIQGEVNLALKEMKIE